QRENLVLRQVYLELQRAQHLPQLARQRAPVRFEDARDLHGQGGAAGDDAAAARGLPGGAQQGRRIHAGMAAEPAVLIGEQRIDVQRRNGGLGGRVAPYAVGVREGAQRRAVARGDQGGVIARFGQRRRERKIESKQQDQPHDRPPAQDRP